MRAKPDVSSEGLGRRIKEAHNPSLGNAPTSFKSLNLKEHNVAQRSLS